MDTALSSSRPTWSDNATGGQRDPIDLPDAADPDAASPDVPRTRCSIQFRSLEFFTTLAKERHFARAAALCHVTQPTLSMGLVSLEEALGGVRLVERDRRFLGLTAEGNAVLPWAKAVIADLDSLRAAVRRDAGGLEGELRLGMVPAAVPMSGGLVKAVLAGHPKMSVALRSMTSQEIASALQAHELDAGLTYLSHEPPSQMRQVPLHRETYLFATRADGPLGDRLRIAWDEALSQPLVLLHDGMQNRRILDAFVASRGLALEPVITADSYPMLLSLVADGGFSTIVTDSFAPFMPGAGEVRMIPFADPPPPNELGLIIPDRPRLAPLAEAIFSIAQRRPM
jgi:DNA-binding transcriptional LysR family regulator